MTAQPVSDERIEQFMAERPHLFAVAYRLLGGAEDAEDVLQEAWLRFNSAAVEGIENPRAYLTTIVTRLALDQMRSARVRREQYVGIWLPEPVPTDEALPEDLAELRDSASFAFLLLLERLNPIERAVLVLHDVFDFLHEEIGAMIDRSVPACRQTLRRAHAKLGPNRPSQNRSVDEVELEALLSAMRDGDALRVTSMLAPDIVLLSDGGGKAKAINRPLVGGRAVGRFLANIEAMFRDMDGSLEDLNGQAALVFRAAGQADTVMVFDVTAAGVSAIYAVRNPDKLRRLNQAQDS